VNRRKIIRVLSGRFRLLPGRCAYNARRLIPIGEFLCEGTARQSEAISTSGSHWLPDMSAATNPAPVFLKPKQETSVAAEAIKLNDRKPSHVSAKVAIAVATFGRRLFAPDPFR
jgi:hypothetical protein